VTARLHGDQAIGFVTEGDWVEVEGTLAGGFLEAKAAFNHTSGAQFRSRSVFACGPAAGLMLFLSLGAFTLIVGFLVRIAGL
jgi:hypothetical protein